jgi:hypothetical protein
MSGKPPSPVLKQAHTARHCSFQPLPFPRRIVQCFAYTRFDAPRPIHFGKFLKDRLLLLLSVAAAKSRAAGMWLVACLLAVRSVWGGSQ